MSRLSLFLHSTGTGSSLWDSVPAELLGERLKLAPPFLGYPPGPPLPRGEPCDVKRDARHVLSALPAEAESIDLYAHSYGAVVALELLESLRPRLRSMWLYEPVLFGALAAEQDPAVDPAAVADARGFIEHPWFVKDDARGGSEAWLELFIDYWNRAGSFQRMPAEQRAHSLRMGWKMYQEVKSCFFDIRSFDEHPLAGLPVSLVTGDRSTRAARAMVQALAQKNPSARVIEVPGTGHMGPLTHPERAQQAMQAHLRGLEGLQGQAALG